MVFPSRLGGEYKNFDGKPFKITDQITQSQADSLLDNQIRNQFLPPLRKIPHWNEMNSNQKGALLSFAYNLGANFYGSSGFNTISRVLRNKQWNDVPDALYLYRNPGTNVEAGLVPADERQRAIYGKHQSKEQQ